MHFEIRADEIKLVTPEKDKSINILSVYLAVVINDVQSLLQELQQNISYSTFHLENIFHRSLPSLRLVQA